MSPLQGFGQLWQKTFCIRLNGAQVKPAEVIKTWKERFPTFYRRAGALCRRGVLYVYEPQGHMFAGWITFSAYEEDDGCTVAQIQMQVRANDLPHEIGLPPGWLVLGEQVLGHTLASLAAHFGVAEPVQTHFACIDPRVQWSQFWNIWQNEAIRTFLYRMLTPLRWLLTYLSRTVSTTGTR